MTSYQVGCVVIRGAEPTFVQCYGVYIGVFHQLCEFTRLDEKRLCWVLHRPGIATFCGLIAVAPPPYSHCETAQGARARLGQRFSVGSRL